jgi:hypothetical protein
MKRVFLIAFLACLVPAVAQAGGHYNYHGHGDHGHYDHGGSHFSIALGFGFGGGYYDRGYCAPRYVAPAPVYVAPPPVVYYQPSYCPPPVVYTTPRVYYYDPAPCYTPRSSYHYDTSVRFSYRH